MAKIATKKTFERLKILIECYLHSGHDYMIHPVSLDVARWAQYFPYFSRTEKSFIEVTNSLSRQQVFEVFESFRIGRASLTSALVAAMAWSAKHPSDVIIAKLSLQRLSKNNSFEETLKRIAAVEEPLSAYKALMSSFNENEISRAFAIKFLYFTSSQDNRAPMFNFEILKWLRVYDSELHQGLWRLVSNWDLKSYERYLDFCSEICELLGIDDRGLVEYLMFVDAQYSDYLELGKAQPLWITSVPPLGWPEKDLS